MKDEIIHFLIKLIIVIVLGLTTWSIITVKYGEPGFLIDCLIFFGWDKIIEEIKFRR